MRNQVLLTALFLAVEGFTTPPSSVSQALGDSRCVYNELQDAIDCSGVMDIAEVSQAMSSLADLNMVNFTNFWLNNNPRIWKLPVDLLGDVRFRIIEVVGSPVNTYEDFLGASRDTVEAVDLSITRIQTIPTLKSSSLQNLTIVNGFLNNIKKQDLAGMPNIKVLSLRSAGTSAMGVHIEEGSFTSLTHLEVLDMSGSLFPGRNVTQGSFIFASPALKTVDISGTYINTIHPGAFGGFTSNSSLTIMLPHPVTSEAFYDVFNSGAQVYTTEVNPCQCNLAWLHKSTFRPQAHFNCVVRQDYVSFQDLPENYFDYCCQA